jgi:acetate kinase
VLTDEKSSAAEVPDVPTAMTRVGGWLTKHLGGSSPVAVGHRVAHGGPAYATPPSAGRRWTIPHSA